MAADPNWRDWADLIAGPACLIAERVLADDVADYLHFHAVCRTWRRSATSPHTLGTIRKRGDFLNVSTGERIQVDLPELCYQHVQYTYTNTEAIHNLTVFMATSDGGLIVLCDKRTYVVRLLNPLTRQLTSLPPASTLLYTASSQTRCCKRSSSYPGDKQWTRLHIGYGDETIASSPFAGRFYCVTRKAIMAPQLAVAAELGYLGSMRLYDWTVKLVDNGGKLILARRIPYDKNNISPKGYEVHHVDLEARITIPMQQGLGGRALRSCGCNLFK
ncbi:hypothetical protein VPH35_032416 [Triticum aestivum]